MDVWRITLAALRRWYVLLPLLAVTGVAAMFVGRGVAPEYEASAAAMITPGPAPAEIANPYGNLDTANTALGIVLNSVESRQHVQSQGLVASYEVGAAPRSSIFQFTARGPDSDAVVETGDVILELAEQELSERQSDAGIPAEAQFTVEVLEPPAIVSVVQTGKTRIQAVIGVAGAAIALLVAVLFDDIVGLVKRRRKSRKAGKERADATGRDLPDQTSGQTVSIPNSEPNADPDAVIHTDQWVWPEDQRPVPSGRPRRNPYFDPEFTRRSNAKANPRASNGRTGHRSTEDGSDHKPGETDEPHSVPETAHRP